MSNTKSATRNADSNRNNSDTTADFGTTAQRARKLNERQRAIARRNARKLKAAGYSL